MPTNSDPRAILQDPDFYKLSPDDQRQLMTGADPQFGQLDQAGQMQILQAAAQQHGHLAPALSSSQQSTLGEVNSGLGAVDNITNAFRHAVMPVVDTVKAAFVPPPASAFPPDFPKVFGGSPLIQNIALGVSHNLQKAKTQFQSGNPAGGLAYGAAAAFPPAGVITNIGEELRGANPQTGLVPPGAHPDYSGAIGDVLGLVAPMALTEGAGALTGKFKVGVGNHLTPEMRQAADYLRSNNVPLSIGQATGSRAAQGLQALGEHIPGAAGVLDDFRDLQQQRINDLAKSQVGGRSPGFYGAGSSTQQALNKRIRNLHVNADQAYNQWRALNAVNKKQVLTGHVPLEKADPAAFRQRLGGQSIPIREIFNALDSSTSPNAVPTPSGHLAIMTDQDANAINTAAQVKQQILGMSQPGAGGTTIPAQTLYDAISTPGMSSGAFANASNAIRGVLQNHFPQTFEAQVPIMQEMESPVDMRNLKAAIKPVADEYEKTLNVTKGQASPGYAVLRQILDDPDFVPADIADRNLGALKHITREFTGLKSGPAKFAIPELSKAIEDNTANSNPQALTALHNGRNAVKAEYDVRDLLNRLPSEPAQLVKRLSQGDDTAVNDLTLIKQHAPLEMPKIAQTVLEDIIQNATSEGGYRKAAQTQNMWNNLGPRTKEMLFGPQKAKDLDNLFRGARLLGGDANPSGTAKVGALGSTAVKMFVSPLEGAVRLMGAKKLAEVLTSPKSVDQVLGGKGIGVGKLPTGRTPARIATYMRLLHPDEQNQQQQPQQ